MKIQMIRKIALAIVVISLTTSCVSKKIYQDLENKYADLKKEHNALSDENGVLKADKNQLELDKNKLQTELDKTKAERDKLASDYAATKKSLDNLKDSYAALEKDSNEALESNINKNRQLLAELEAKQKALTAEQDRLNKLKKDLETSSKRLAELEKMIADKDAAMKKLKETLTKSLKAFEGKGLTVTEKDGKVYVSMENKLLFESGSWTVGAEGKKAVDLVGKVLGDNPEISVLIEGHTDNVPFTGNSVLTDNWDLSVKRSTAIVRVLTKDLGVKPSQLIAAGRGEYIPLVENKTAENRATNRRTRIVILPKIDEFYEMIEKEMKKQ